MLAWKRSVSFCGGASETGMENYVFHGMMNHFGCNHFNGNEQNAVSSWRAKNGPYSVV